MALTDLAIRSAKSKDKPFKLFDEGGLFLLVNPSGSKSWRFKYRFAGKEKLLVIGPYPVLSLKDARDKRDRARRLLADAVDPAAVKQQQKVATPGAEEDSFELVAREWFVSRSKNWATSHSGKILGRLENDVFPWIGKQPINEIDAKTALGVLRRIEERGALETAHRVLQNLGSIFRYAVSTQRIPKNPVADLKGALAPWKEKHYATITEPNAVGRLLRDIEGYKGSFITRSAMMLAPLVFVRPGELRRAEWSEFDFDRAQWVIPLEKMKAASCTSSRYRVRRCPSFVTCNTLLGGADTCSRGVEVRVRQ